VDPVKRIPVQVGLGCHVEGVALPQPCPNDPATMRAGVMKRFARAPPKPNPELMGRFNKFVRSWLSKNLAKLSPGSDTSIEKWLEGTSYPAWRKDELRKKMSEFTHLDDPSKKYKWCKSFMKDETYVSYKHARGINSRSDEFKCLVGPIFKLIESEVYECHHFIKHVPVADRPRVIAEALDKLGAKFMATDYTAFESLFTADLMEACEFELYDYMTSELPEHREFMRICHEILGGTNVCQYKSFVVQLLATRMSGEMCTSLGNGFTNLMVMLFLCEDAGCTEVDGYVEGDDGIFSMIGTPPSSARFAELGLIIKIELHDRLSTASFCGIIFDEFDRINVTDPREVLASIGWTSTRYARAKPSMLKTLLRCKGLSLAHQYPGCPVISSLSQYLLRVTRSHDVRRVLEKDRLLSMWDREQLAKALKDEKNIRKVDTPMATRLLIEDKFDLPVDVQLSIERYFDSLEELQPLNIPIFRSLCPKEWGHYYDSYTGGVQHRLSLELEYPALFNKMAGWKTGF
jgi:hypothetical protein